MMIKQKLIRITISLALVMGLATAPAFALPTTNIILDNNKYDNYLAGADGYWYYSESTTTNVSYPAGNTWATAMLRQLYSVFKYTYYIDQALSSNSTYQTSNFGKAMYYLGSNTFQNDVANIESYLYNINGYLNTISGYLNTYLPDLKSGITSANQHLGSIYSMLGYSNSNTLKSNIDSVISGITSSNTNTSNIKSVLDNLYGALGYNSAGTLKTAINSIISNTSDISGIKSGTDYIDDIVADTASLPTIENNSSAIKINSDYIPSINTYTSNLPGIKAGTDYLDDIYNAVSGISIPTYNLDDVSWINSGNVLGVSSDASLNYLTEDAGLQDFYIVFSLDHTKGNLIKVSFPVYSSSRNNIYPVIDIGNISGGGDFYSINNAYIVAQSSSVNQSCNEVIIYIPFSYTRYNNSNFYIHLHEDNFLTYAHSSLAYSYVKSLDNSKKDFYQVSNFDFLYNILGYTKNLNSILSDPVSEAAKANNVSNQTTVLTNFTGSGAASASSADFTGVKDSVTQLKSALSGGASYSQTFNIFGGSSDGWSWFSQEVADSMDSSSQSRNMLRSNLSSSTPYLDSYYDSIYSVLGIGGDIE